MSDDRVQVTCARGWEREWSRWCSPKSRKAGRKRGGSPRARAATWRLRAPVRWLHRACLLHSASPGPTAHGGLWEGDLPPRNLLVSVTLSPFGHCKDRCSQPRWWPVGVPHPVPPSRCVPFVPSAPGSRCLCSSDTGWLQAAVHLLQKAHPQPGTTQVWGPGQSRDSGGGAGKVSSLLLPCVPVVPLVAPLPES